LHPFAYVPNGADGTVSVIDTATNHVVATVAVGSSPGAVAVSPVEPKAFIANARDDSVSVIDTNALAVVATISVGGSPFAPINLAVSHQGTRLYVVNQTNPGRVVVVDTATNAILGTIEVGDYPFGIVVTPDDRRVFVTNTSDDRERRPCFVPTAYCDLTVSVIDTDNMREATRITVGDSPAGIAIAPAGNRVYVANKFLANGDLTNVISVIDPQTNSVIDRLQHAAYNLTVSPDGGVLYALGATLSAIDSHSGMLINSISVDLLGARSLALSRDGSRLYVVNTNTDSVSVIDSASLSIVTSIPVGHEPLAFGQFIGPETTPTPSLTPTKTPTFLHGEGGTPTHTVPRPAPCLGDCNGDNRVSIDEIIMAVNIALGTVSIETCRPCDGDMDGLVTVEELVKAVANAVGACPQ
jgi:YVTN family beta-propeller protein